MTRLSRPELARMARFAAVGVSGIVVNLAVLKLWLAAFPDQALPAQAVGWAVAVTTNWWLNRQITFVEGRDAPWVQQWARFVAVNALGGVVAFACYAVLVTGSSLFAAHPGVASLVGIAAGFGCNYLGAVTVMGGKGRSNRD